MLLLLLQVSISKNVPSTVSTKLRQLEVNTASVLVTTVSYNLVLLVHIVRTPWCIKGGPILYLVQLYTF